MKLSLALMVGFFSVNTFAADFTLYCVAQGTLESCAQKTESALKKLGCKVNALETNCDYSLVPDAQNPDQYVQSDTAYCKITSVNCSAPLPGVFGSENCFDREKIQIPKQENVNNGYWFGFFGPYSRTVCRQK